LKTRPATTKRDRKAGMMGSAPRITWPSRRRLVQIRASVGKSDGAKANAQMPQRGTASEGWIAFLQKKCGLKAKKRRDASSSSFLRLMLLSDA
jgi:hypothetical protein